MLLLDIETAPNIAHVWGLYKQNVGINQIQAPGYVMCWAAKWYGDTKVSYARVGYENGQVTGAREMLEPIWAMLDEADIVVHYNGKSFDIPTLNKEFVLHGFMPPSPYRQVDLLKVCRAQFRWPSNKLDYVCRQLGIGKKVKHAGHELWNQCMAGDERAWATMRRYNRNDVVILEALYDRLMPWIKGHPNHNLWSGRPCCVRCGSHNLQSRGTQVTTSLSFARYQCTDCGTWNRSAKGGKAVEIRECV